MGKITARAKAGCRPQLDPQVAMNTPRPLIQPPRLQLVYKCIIFGSSQLTVIVLSRLNLSGADAFIKQNPYDRI